MLGTLSSTRGGKLCILERRKTYLRISKAFVSPRVVRRGLATVTDTPVRRYGGLKDQVCITCLFIIGLCCVALQDRIFTNAYCKHDHGIKGAMVREEQVETRTC